jgi:transcriptional regulator with XRE-family HTH domain
LTLIIKELRTKQGLSQRKLAELSGVPKTNIGDIETHRKLPRQDELVKIAAALGVAIEGLYKVR